MFLGLTLRFRRQMWTLAPLPKLSAMEDNVSSGQRTPTTPEHESGTLPAVSLNAPTPPRWGESLVIRPFVPTSAVLQPRARQIYPKKPAPPNIKVFQSQAEQGKPLLAFLAALAPGLTAAAPLLGKLGIDCKEDLERLHPAWWPDFFDQEVS